MFSRTIELLGLALVSYALALGVGTPVGLAAGGLSLLLLGATTDDAQVSGALRAGSRGVRGLWRKQLARENGEIPDLPPEVPCFCGGDAECPICHGAGSVPNPEARVGSGPHPPLVVDPELEAEARALAKRRLMRGDGRLREVTRP